MIRTQPRARFLLVGIVTMALLAVRPLASTLRSNFVETRIVSGLANPTAMAFAPDGRLFVCEQGGRLRVVENGVLLSAPFTTVTVNASGERGLLGVAFDPDFVTATNKYVYIYYTATAPALSTVINAKVGSTAGLTTFAATTA